ncbi:MAG: FAD:protein FMN transferase [Thermodesulfobacteriota bacterium]
MPNTDFSVKSVDRRTFLKYSGILGAGMLLSPVLPAGEAVAFGRGRYRITRTRMMMGTFAAITVIGPSRDEADDAISLAFDDMQKAAHLFDRHQDISPIGTLNREGRAADLDPEITALLERSLRLCKTTRGAFDITVKPVVDLYQNAFASHQAPPSDEGIAKVLDLVNPGAVRIQGRTVRFAKEGMGVTLDGIAKGYAIDCGMNTLKRRGIGHALINAGGDIRTMGGRGRFSPWRVAVQNPDKEGPALQTFTMEDGAAATSGNYEVYFDEEKVYHHLIDPHSARPAQESRSVTVLAANATLADALSTAVFVAGPKDGRALIETLSGAECLLVTAGGARVSSSRWPSAGTLFTLV